jgi:hypothetical protein
LAERETRAEVTLYGPGWRFYPWALMALEQALRRGLGKERRVWTVQEVRRVTPDRQGEPVAGPGLSSLPPTLMWDLAQKHIPVLVQQLEELVPPRAPETPES